MPHEWDELVDAVVGSARLEGHDPRPEALALMIAFARGEMDRDTYLVRAAANIDDLRHRVAVERANRAAG